MLNDNAHRLFLWLGLSAGVACAAGSGSGARPPEGTTSAGSTAAAPFEAELHASPPISAPPATPATAPAAVAPAPVPPAPVPIGSLECVVPPDPELEKESTWSREVGQRLERELSKLQSCSAGLPPEEQALTLRLVYAKDGSPLSQHVVTSTPNACAAVECLKRGLASVRGPELVIDKASIDLNLALAPNQPPRRSAEPVDPLAPEPLPENADGCVDPEVARLSRVAVRETVSTAYPGLERCYALALERDHTVTGKVNFEFVIGRDGAVAETWAREATLPDCGAIRCMLDQFRALHFPEPVGRSVRVLYPISYVVEQSPVILR